MEVDTKNLRIGVLLMGIAAIVFGLCAVIFTPDTIATMFVFLAVYWIADGIFGIFAGATGAVSAHRWTVFFLGLLSVGAGVIALRRPAESLAVIMMLLGLWALVSGFSEIFGAFDLRSAGIAAWWIALLEGVVSIALGVLMVVAPFNSLSALTWAIGIWSVVRGVLLVGVSFKLGNRTTVAL